jgi:hypothetical protein
MMSEIIIRTGCGCLWCDELIPNSEAIKGKMICSITCLNEMNSQQKTNYDIGDVWKTAK